MRTIGEEPKKYHFYHPGGVIHLDDSELPKLEIIVVEMERDVEPSFVYFTGKTVQMPFGREKGTVIVPLLTDRGFSDMQNLVGEIRRGIPAGEGLDDTAVQIIEGVNRQYRNERPRG